MFTISRIDPKVRFITVGQLRRAETEMLRSQPLVVQEGDTPIAVAMPYETFLAMQEAIEAGGRRVQELELRLAAADAAGKTLGDLVNGGVRR